MSKEIKYTKEHVKQLMMTPSIVRLVIPETGEWRDELIGRVYTEKEVDAHIELLEKYGVTFKEKNNE